MGGWNTPRNGREIKREREKERKKERKRKREREREKRERRGVTTEAARVKSKSPPVLQTKLLASVPVQMMFWTAQKLRLAVIICKEKRNNVSKNTLRKKW